MQYLLPVVCCTIPIHLLLSSTDTDFLYAPAPFIMDTDMHAPRELVRRYIHAYGPTDLEEFSEWAGISPLHAQRLWSTFPSEELVQVRWDIHEGWMLKCDLDDMYGLPAVEGIRFLGPYDPLLDLPMRNSLIHGKSLYKYFFRSEDRPGLVLYDGSLVAGWCFKRKRNGFSLVLEDIGESLGRVATEEISEEASHVADSLGLVLDGISIVGK